MSSLKEKVIFGTIWRFAEQIGTQAIVFCVSIVLARILEPEEFGTIALLTIFIAVSNTLINSGLGTALIRRKDVDDLDISTVFYFNLAIGLLLYLTMFLCAPVIASFYSRPILIPILRVYSLSLVLGAISNVQNVVLSRRMWFAKSFWITLPATITNGAVGISMAYAGFGVWALAISSLTGNVVATALRWIVIGWRPLWQFSFARLRSLFSFGAKMLATSLVATVSDQIYGLLIGKWYSAKDLAYFNRGDHIPQILMNTVQASISGVTLPAFSQMQDDTTRLRNAARKVIKASTLALCPMMFGLAAISDTLVRVLLTEKWLPCVPYMRLACVTCALWPLYVVNLQVIVAKGEGSLYFWLEAMKKALLLITLCVTFKHGVLAIAVGRMAMTPICVLINSWPNRKIIGYSPWRQLWDVAPNFAMAGIMMVLVYIMQFYPATKIMTLVLQVVVGVLSFGILLFSTDRSAFDVIYSRVRKVIVSHRID